MPIEKKIHEDPYVIELLYELARDELIALNRQYDDFRYCSDLDKFREISAKRQAAQNRFNEMLAAHNAAHKAVFTRDHDDGDDAA